MLPGCAADGPAQWHMAVIRVPETVHCETRAMTTVNHDAVHCDNKQTLCVLCNEKDRADLIVRYIASQFTWATARCNQACTLSEVNTHQATVGSSSGHVEDSKCRCCDFRATVRALGVTVRM